MKKIDSWEVSLEDNVAIKNADKTFIEAVETGIPQDTICDFFECGNMQMGDVKIVSLLYKGKEYKGRIRKKNDHVGRVNLSWRGELHDALKEKYKNNVTVLSMRFLKTNRDNFEVSLVEETKILNDANMPSETKEYITAREGKQIMVYTTKYERDPRLRREAILIHGCKCEVCGFDFEEKYGEIGIDYIEVHHKKPLSEVGEEIEVDPKTDLACLCSNCHRMIHRNREKVLTIEELKSAIKA